MRCQLHPQSELVMTYSLPATVVTYDNCERGIKLDDLDMLVVEGPNTPDSQLIERRPASQRVFKPVRQARTHILLCPALSWCL
jgi:hypothetical protein